MLGLFACYPPSLDANEDCPPRVRKIIGSIRADVLREMTCRVVRLACFKFEGGLNLAANLLSHGTASMETAAGRDIDGAGQITSEDNTLPPFLDLRVGDRHGREQGFGIRMLWGCIEIIAVW